jgi:serine/alanine adding enzyme
LATLLDPGRPVFLHAEGAAFACIVREFEDRADVITPYGYGGPVARDLHTASGLHAGYETWCAEHGIVSTFVRFHPLYENHRYSEFHVERLGATIAWRLGDDLFERMHSHHRRVVRKAERAGTEVSVTESPADLHEFVELYERTMDRRDADVFYRFSREYWDGLRALVVRADARLAGELAASVLCFFSPPWLHYHLGATSDEGRRVGASNLVLYEAARWGHERGCELFHLGGGVGGAEDSLLEFKRRFDPEGRREFAVGKAVHDPEAYRALTHQADVSLAGFFPAYRGRR